MNEMLGMKEKMELAKIVKALTEEYKDIRIKGDAEEVESKVTEKTSGETLADTSKENSNAIQVQELDDIHVRKRRGQATDSHSLAERVRREKIRTRMKLLQELVPGCSKIKDKAVRLDEIINYVQSLQRQVEFLSMKPHLHNLNLKLQSDNDDIILKEFVKAEKDKDKRIKEHAEEVGSKVVDKTSGETSVDTAKENPKAIHVQKPDYIHVQARPGQATDSHSLAERVRRGKISERMKYLQDLVPGCKKVTGKAVLLDEITNYVQSLQRQVEYLSMKSAALNPKPKSNIDDIFLNEFVKAEEYKDKRIKKYAEVGSKVTEKTSIETLADTSKENSKAMQVQELAALNPKQEFDIDNISLKEFPACMASLPTAMRPISSSATSTLPCHQINPSQRGTSSGELDALLATSPQNTTSFCITIAELYPDSCCLSVIAATLSIFSPFQLDKVISRGFAIWAFIKGGIALDSQSQAGDVFVDPNNHLSS